MVTIYDEIKALVGDVPAEYDFLAWIFALFFMLFFIHSLLCLFGQIIKWVGGRG